MENYHDFTSSHDITSSDDSISHNSKIIYDEQTSNKIILKMGDIMI